MKAKNIIIIVVAVIVLLIGGTIVLRKIKSKDIEGDITSGSEVEVKVPEPIGQRKFDGNIDLGIPRGNGFGLGFGNNFGGNIGGFNPFI